VSFSREKWFESRENGSALVEAIRAGILLIKSAAFLQNVDGIFPLPNRFFFMFLVFGVFMYMHEINIHLDVLPLFVQWS